MLPYFFVLLGALLRVIPHPANFAPIAGVAMFGGAYLNKKLAIVLPLAAMIISDFFIGFDSWQSRVAVYGCFIFSGLIGLWIRNHKSATNIILGSVLGSVVFYLVTNFVYFHGAASLYPQTFDGMVSAYINAIPFFRNTLLGDIFYVAVFFGSYELVKAWHVRFSYAKNNQG
ncbi:MAG TPA: DUF6580 family putative transport protein [Verrucomicrobiae bacterium]|nr:DUF6580 family putative transport protein [Verrucomicrobiae bacterium]